VDGARWDDAAIGYYSTAIGYDTTASGSASTAMGDFTTASGYACTAMGSATTASGYASTAMGVLSTASGYASTSMGYFTTASGSYSTASGYNTTASGTASTAIGYFASTTDSGGTPRNGTFVWGDTSTTTLVRPTANNQFVARAAGGVTFYSNSAMTTGVTLATGGGSWASVSDRERKRDFAPVDGDDILARLAALPVTSWSYRDDASGRRYIGPVAQDFHALFALGDDTTIATLDVDGVTLAAVKALESRTAALQAANAALEQRVAELGSQKRSLENALETLVRRVASLEERGARPAEIAARDRESLRP
jgi:trimeric autotransporter adhesin